MRLARATFRIGVVVALLCGCRAEPNEAPAVETVDVPPPLEIDVSSDERARQRAPELAGILPQDFPADLPLYLPASVVDFGDGERGRYSVSLLSTHPYARVRRGLFDLVARQGWTLAPGDHGGGLRLLRKGGREAWLRIEERGSTTAYRYEY